MAYYLTANITIGKWAFTYAKSVKVMSSWKELGDTCTIQLPNLKKVLENALKVGDKVKVELGYDGKNEVEFEGYVKELKPKIPFEVVCEDKLFELKRMSVGGGNGLSWRSTTLKTVLKEVLNGVETVFDDSIPDLTLKPFRINKGVTVAEVLQKFKEEYLITAYFRNGVLWIGLAYLEDVGVEVNYDLQRNVVKGNLTYKRKDDVKLKAKAISILADGSKIEVEAGDKEGETRTLHFRGITDKEKLKTIAEKELEKYKYEGYRGNITGFGVPFPVHTGTVNLKDGNYPDRAGRYVVDKVQTVWGRNGFRRVVTIGKKV